MWKWGPENEDGGLKNKNLGFTKNTTMSNYTTNFWSIIPACSLTVSMLVAICMT